MTNRKILGLLLLVAACGGGGGGDDDNAPDASSAPDAPDTSGCYQEANDTGNDGTAPEDSHRILGTTGDAVEICGQIDAREPDAQAGNLIDADVYTFELSTAATIRTTLDAVGADALGDVSIFIYENPITDATADFISFGMQVGDHASLIAPSCYTSPACADVTLPAGSYSLIVQTVGTVQPAAAVAYHATITAYTDNCVTPGTATFTEALDAVGGPAADDNTQNDVYQVGDPWPNTTDATDVPEDSGAALTITADGAFSAAGVAGTHVVANMYKDVDTYTIVTGPDTTDLVVELAWTGAAADDFDWYILGEGAGALDPPVNLQSGADVSNPEVQSTAVLPNTTYHLVVGSYDGSADDLAYTVTVCGSTFTP